MFKLLKFDSPNSDRKIRVKKFRENIWDTKDKQSILAQIEPKSSQSSYTPLVMWRRCLKLQEGGQLWQQTQTMAL